MPDDYVRYLTKDTEPFDPVELARQTEAIACRDGARKYTSFYATGVYGGIATGYTVGCSLRCCYCWVDWSRDFPEDMGKFHTSEEAFGKLMATARDKRVRKARISGAEPTLCRKHLIGLLELVEGSDLDLFVLETNGILLGHDRSYARELARFTKPYVRVSIKAGTPEGFQERTGAVGEAFELPFRAVEHLHEEGADFHVAAMTDPRIMDDTEREEILRRLASVHRRYALRLEEEIIDPYKTAVRRLGYRGVSIEWPRGW
jgi:uncharacterized Fe-S cluster-containing radical SAM superfamily protein